MKSSARAFAATHYPSEEIIRITHRPRDAWVISKKLLGIQGDADPCAVARDCLSKAQGDKVHAVRLYMQSTGMRPGRCAQGDRDEHGQGLVRRHEPSALAVAESGVLAVRSSIRSGDRSRIRSPIAAASTWYTMAIVESGLCEASAVSGVDFGGRDLGPFPTT